MVEPAPDRKRPPHPGVLTAAAVFLLLAVAVGAGIAGRGGGEEPTADQSRRGPDLLSVELAAFDGEAVDLGRYLDRPMVVNFFASWCGPCAREMPGFQAIHVARGDEVAFVGVSLQDAPEAALELAGRTGVTYDLVQDIDSELFRAVGGVSMPTTVFLSASGEVVDVHGGELSARRLEERIDRLLATS
jgi:thiol-disulfide isomerase/thioredoxin